MKRLFFVLAASLCLGSEALAEACTCASESFSASSQTAAGGWDGCTPSADDTFTINSGCTVTLTGDWTLSGAGGITCASGGGLAITGGATKLDFVMGTGGLTIQSGCTFNANGAYLTPGTTPSFVSEPSTETYFQFGDYGTPQTCAGTSCTLARISYPSGVYDSATTSGYDVGLAESVDAIDAGDILSFWNPSGVSTWGSPDVNMQYPVAASSSAGSPFTIDFDVYVAKNQPIPQAGQEIVGTAATTGTTASAGLKGTTTVTVPEDTFSATTAEYAVGRWIRFESGTSGTYEPFGYRILRVTDGGVGVADTVEIADLRGFQYDYASGSDFAVDYGWRRGDPFLVYRPVRFACATDYACTFTFSGTVDVSAVHFEQVQRVMFSGNPTVTSWEDVFIQGVNNGTNASIGVEFDLATTNPVVSMVRTVLVGDDAAADTGGQTTHGFGHGSSGNGAFTLNLTDSMTRFIGDDVFVTYGSGTSYINLTRFRSQWAAEAAASAQFADGAGGTAVLALSGSDVECVACTGDAASSEALFNDDQNLSSFNVSGFLVYGAAGAIHAGASNESLSSFSDVMILGGGQAASANYWWSLPTMNRFVVRGASLTTNVTLANTGVQQDALNWQNGLVYRNAQTSTTAYLVQLSNASTPASTIRNVAFFDNTSAATTPAVFNLSEVKTGSVLENITIAQTPSFTSASGYQRAFQLSDTTDNTYTLRRNLVTGMSRTGTYAILVSGATAWTGLTDATGWCLFNNANTISAFTEAQFFAAPGGQSQIGRPPGLLDPLRLLVGAWSGSLAADYGCGANTRAGITSYRWMHAISGLVPENVGTIGSGGAGGWVPRSF